MIRLRYILSRLWLAAAVAAMAVVVTDCSHSSLYDDVPPAIEQFIAHYYPNSALSSFTATGSSYRAVIKNGPALTFDKQCQWTELDGNGETLPQVFLFNELPPALYAYVQESESLDGVYLARRVRDSYELTLKSTTVNYDGATGVITGEVTPPEADPAPEA